MRFLEERAESLVFLDESNAVRIVRKDAYTIVKYRIFNGLRIRCMAKDASHTLRVEEEEGGGSFILETDGRQILTEDLASVSQALLEYAERGSMDPLLRLWRWHALLKDMSLSVQPNSREIAVTGEGVLSLPVDLSVDVLGRSAYHDGSTVAKLLFVIKDKNDWLYGAFRDHGYAVALIGRDETGQVWMHFVPPEYKDRTIEECEVWLAGGEGALRQGDVVLVPL